MSDITRHTSDSSHSTSLVAYDDESGATITLSDADIRRAHELDKGGTEAMRFLAGAWREIQEKKLYLALGYSSMREYAEDRGIGYTTLKTHIRIARAFNLLPPGPGNTEGPPAVPGEDDSIEDARIIEEGRTEAIWSVGSEKLDMLRKHLPPEEAFDLEIDTEFPLPSGRVTTLRDIKRISKRDLKAEMAAAHKSLSTRAAAAEEALKLRDSELTQLEAEKHQLERRLKDLEADMAKVPAPNVESHKRARIDAAKRYIDDMAKALVASNVDVTEDSRELVEHLAHVIKHLSITCHNMILEYDAIAELDDEYALLLQARGVR